MKKLLVILGPTATGKTDLVIKLAKKFDGELVSCDSRQVYKGLDVGTGKISNLKSQISNVSKKRGYWILDGVSIWMYDVVDPKIQYTVADYVKDAGKVVNDILKREKLPIVVGGTGLYIRALLEGLPNLEIPVDKNLRKSLEKLSIEDLQKKLRELSPKRWQNLNKSDRSNPRRLIRSIEIITMSPYVTRSITAYRIPHTLNILKVGLTASRGVLYRKVDESVETRVKQGMIEEAKKLHKSGLSLKRMRQLGLEYGVLADYLDGKIKEKEGEHGLIRIMQNKIHGYVRRQLTWFKKEKNVVWIDITVFNYEERVEKLILDWYNLKINTN